MLTFNTLPSSRFMCRWVVLLTAAISITSLIIFGLYKAETAGMASLPTASSIKKKFSFCPSTNNAGINYPPPLNYSKLALLVEDRPIPHMTALMLHMMSVVPPDWPFLFLGSDTSISFLNNSLGIRHHVQMGKLEMRNMPAQMKVHGHEELSHTFTAKWFYQDILNGGKWDPVKNVVVKKHTDHMGKEIWVPSPKSPEWLLVFQTDSILCANSKEDLNDWLIYDWVGAPWAEDHKFGGNGGLSLRRISKIIDVLDKESRKPGDPELEDLWLVNRMWQLPGAFMADAQKEKQFSVEALWYDTPMGYHTGWSGARLPGGVWGEPWKRKHILDEWCPEMKMTLELSMPQFREQEERLRQEELKKEEDRKLEEAKKQLEQAEEKKAEEEKAKKEEEEKNKLAEESAKLEGEKTIADDAVEKRVFEEP